MTLEEAIQHCHEVAKENRKTALEYARAYAWDTAHECRECANEHEQLATWLAELKECRERTRWIPCSERLPERETDVLVYIPVWEENSIQVAYLMYDGITWELSDGEFNFGKREVLYWMPLPEPPEVNEDA